MEIELSGYLQHREMHNLASLCSEHGFACPVGYFTDAAFVTDEDLPQQLADLISATFAPQSLAEAKARKQAEIHDAYDAALAAGCPTSAGYALRCEEADLDQWARLATLLLQAVQAQQETLAAEGADAATLGLVPDAVTAEIEDASGQGHTVSYRQLRDLLIEVGVHVQALWAHLSDLRRQTRAAETVAELEAVVW